MKTLAFIAAAACATVSPVARAEPVPAKARKLADHGRTMHERGDYARAIVAFKEAYVIAPSAGLLFNLAQAYRLQGNCDDAAIMYRRFLATSPSIDARSIADVHLKTVERCLQKRSLNIPMDEGMAYLEVPPPPGPEQLLVEPPATPADPGSLRKDLGTGAMIGGSVALGLAMYYGLRAHSSSKEVERAYAEGAKWDEIADVHADGQRSARKAMVFGISGGIAAVGGITLFVLGKRAELASPVAVMPTSGGAEVSVAWRY